ncbi:MAG: hypothetical protein IK066_11095 [Kiritimatiellae bacterium]|nr:hypothetical protein [Kiritimatiellia bacterium]
MASGTLKHGEGARFNAKIEAPGTLGAPGLFAMQTTEHPFLNFSVPVVPHRPRGGRLREKKRAGFPLAGPMHARADSTKAQPGGWLFPATAAREDTRHSIVCGHPDFPNVTAPPAIAGHFTLEKNQFVVTAIT